MSEKPRTSILTFDTRLRERVANLARDTALHARTGEEAAQIRSLSLAVRQGNYPARDALEDLRRLRSQQQQAA